MSSADFFAASKVLIVAGKGGVGKTTVGVSLGLAAAQCGFDVLLIELEGHSNLGAPFGHNRLSYDEQTLLDSGAKIGISTSPNRTLRGRLRARQITPDAALVEYLETSDMGRIVSRLARSGLVELVASAAPGIRDVVTLGKVRQLSDSGSADLIIVDAPAAGHALSFLLSATGLRNVVGSGPIRYQADQVLELLADPSRCRAALVTLPEETPISEVVETAFRLEDEVHLSLTPIIVNNVLGGRVLVGPTGTRSELAGALSQVGSRRQTQKLKALVNAAEFQRERGEAQQSQIDRLEDELPLHQLILPTVPSVRLDLESISLLAKELESQLDDLGQQGSAR